MQKDWFTNQNSVYYQSRLINAQIYSLEQTGALEKGKYTYKDLSVAEDVYNEMMADKADADTAFASLDKAGIQPSSALSATASGLYGQAKLYYSWRDYLDASSFAKAALQAAGL